jgi:hypothetical protein
MHQVSHIINRKLQQLRSVRTLADAHRPPKPRADAEIYRLPTCGVSAMSTLQNSMSAL